MIDAPSTHSMRRTTRTLYTTVLRVTHSAERMTKLTTTTTLVSGSDSRAPLAAAGKSRADTPVPSVDCFPARIQQQHAGNADHQPASHLIPGDETSATDRIGERWPPSLASGE